MLSTVSRPPIDTMTMATTSSLPIILPPRPPPQRPKLSINTEQPRILGKAASLRLETLSAISPTVRNTYSNALEQPSTAPTLQRPSKPRLCIDSTLAPSHSASTPDSASTLCSTLTSASQDSAASVVPYKQPHHLASILSNSPAKSVVPRKMASSRPMFPAEKRVSFRSPLEEEIKTVKYTLAHSDLASSSSTLSSISSTISTTSSGSDSSAIHHSIGSTASHTLVGTNSASFLSMSDKFGSVSTSIVNTSRPTSPRTGEKRDSSSSEDESDTCPQTPIAGRRKRTRDWRWTLGPLPSTSASSSSDTNTTSEDSS